MNCSISITRRSLSIVLSLSILWMSAAPAAARPSLQSRNIAATHIVTPVAVSPVGLKAISLDLNAPQQLELFTPLLPLAIQAPSRDRVSPRPYRPSSADAARRQIDDKEIISSASEQLAFTAQNLESAGRVMDGSHFSEARGFLPQAKRTDIELDPTPKISAITSGRKLSRNVTPLNRSSLLKRVLGTLALRRSVSEVVALPGNPQDEASIERTIRQMIDSSPELFGGFEGLKSENLQTVRVLKVKGQAGLEDTVYVNFRQHLDNIPVDTTYLEFRVRIVNGLSTIFSWHDNLLPELRLNTAGVLTPEEQTKKVKDRLGKTPEAFGQINDWGLRIMHWDGQWRVARIYATEKRTIALAVDINHPQARVYAWEIRVPQRNSSDQEKSESAEPKQMPLPLPRDPNNYPLKLIPVTENASGASGTAIGRGVESGPQKPDTVLKELRLGHLKITTSEGKTYFTDENGSFTVEGTGNEVEVTVRLHGKYAEVANQSGPDLIVTARARPGDRLQVVFNPQGADEHAVADVTGYHWITETATWLIARGLSIFTDPITVNTNIDEECNAYFDYRSLNFFKKSKRCANTSYDGVAPHEFGHYTDYLAHGNSIPDGGLSEAIGDVLVMFMRNIPQVGLDFFVNEPGSFIRDGENDYQYREYDEVHDKGQAYMGFAWKLRKALIASLGAIPGASLAEALVVPVILETVPDIPAAIKKVLERDIDKNGDVPHWEAIRDAAAAHGIKLKKPVPSKPRHDLREKLLRAPFGWNHSIEFSDMPANNISPHTPLSNLADAWQIDPKDVILHRKVQSTMDRMLDDMIDENSGFFGRLFGNRALAKKIAAAFRMEMNLGRKPSFKAYRDTAGGREYLLLNGKHISEALWDSLIRNYGLSEADLQRYLEIQKKLGGPYNAED